MRIQKIPSDQGMGEGGPSNIIFLVISVIQRGQYGPALKSNCFLRGWGVCTHISKEPCSHLLFSRGWGLGPPSPLDPPMICNGLSDIREDLASLTSLL